MAWTNTTDKNTGYLVTAGDYNILQDNLDYLKGTTAQELFIPPTIYNYQGVYNVGAFYSVLFPATCSMDALFSIKVPDDFVSFESVKAVWGIVAATTTQEMWWGMKGEYVAPGDYLGVGGAASSQQDYPGSTDQTVPDANTIVVNEPVNPLTLSELAVGDYLGIAVTRNASEATDNAGDALLMGVLFTYTGRFTST